MPLSTFSNLPATRQEEIRALLLDLFARHEVSEIKVSQIVTALGMSRGIFYKYFSDLTDAYDYMVGFCAHEIHASILASISQFSDDFFQGIEAFLVSQIKTDQNSEERKKIRLLTRNMQAFSMRPSANHGVEQWRSLLERNHFCIHGEEEAVAFLFFIMHFVIDTLADALTNQWSSDDMLHEFRHKVNWLKHGMLEPTQLEESR